MASLRHGRASVDVAVDMVTNLSTLLAGGEVVQLAQGSCGTVAAVPGWREFAGGLTPTDDVDRAFRKALTLAHTPLEQAIRANWCSRLSGRADMFEVRINGVRFYGGRITTAGQPPTLILLFAGAEQKSGSRSADQDVLDRAEAKLNGIRQLLAQESATVVLLHGRRGGAKSKGAQ